MPRSDWDKRLTPVAVAGFCFAAIFGTITIIYVVAFLNGEQSSRRHEYPGAHAQTAKEQAEKSCTVADARALFECVYEKVEASEETARGEQDLTAQQRAAWASVVAAVISAFATLTSIIGIWFIWKTLEATREAVLEARKGTDAALVAAKAAKQGNLLAAEQFESSFRPFLMVRPEGHIIDLRKLLPFEDDREERIVPISVSIRVENRGEMPAVIVGYDVWIDDSIPCIKASPAGCNLVQNCYLELSKGEVLRLAPAGGEHSSLRATCAPNYGDIMHPIHLGKIMMTMQNRSLLMMNPPPIFGYVRYLDPIGNERAHSFSFRSNGIWGDSFERFGGMESNYDRKQPNA